MYPLWALKKLHLGILLTVTIPFLLGSIQEASAATVTWDGSGDGKTASQGANWVGGVAPTGADDIKILTNCSPSPELAFDIAMTLTGSLEIGASCNVGNQAAFTNGGQIDVFGVYRTGGWTNAVAGTVDIHSGGQFLIRGLVNENFGTINQDGTNGVAGNAKFTNKNGGIFTVTNMFGVGVALGNLDSEFLNEAGATYNSDGDLDIRTADATHTIVFTNAGIFNEDCGHNLVNDPITDAGGTINDICSTAVGGALLPLDSTMVLVAGTQTTAAWMIPAIVSAIGIGIVIARKF